MGLDLDNRALPGVYVGVVMGRHAGFLTASAALARKLPDDGPHAIYVPERAFDVDEFLGTVNISYGPAWTLCHCRVRRHQRQPNHVPVAQSLMGETEKDPHGNVQLGGRCPCRIPDQD